MSKYLLVVWSDVDPEVLGPFEDDAHRLRAAKKIRRDDPEMEHGLFPVDCETKPQVGTFAGFELSES